MTEHLILTARTKDLGGFNVGRVLPTAKRKMVGPFIFFDHMGPADFPPGDGINVRPHPHINLATVTYLFEGEILHRDSVGSVQAIAPGAINLMVAGNGITHSERVSDATRASGQRMHGLQLWMALPEAMEETAPAFTHYPANTIPERREDGLHIRQMMGEAFGLHSPVQTFAYTIYSEITLSAGTRLALPNGVAEMALYVLSGTVEWHNEAINAHTMLILDGAADETITATQDTHFVIIGGEHLGQRYIEWNFVSSRQERIVQAKEDWKAQRFPKIDGDSGEYIPLP